MSRRIIEIDIARGLAALAVVLIHVAEVPLGVNCTRGAGTLFYITLEVVSRFAVPMFVLLSGTGLALSHRTDEKYASFLIRRLSKIAPAYVVWSLIYSVILISPHHIGWRDTGMMRILHNLLTGDASYHLYFVPKIILLYVLFPPIYSLVSTKYGMLICALATVVLTIIRFTADFTANLGIISVVGGSLSWVLFFALGIWLAQRNLVTSLKQPRYRRPVAVVLPIFLAATVAFVYLSATSAHTLVRAITLMKLFAIPYVPLLITWICSRDWTDSRLVPAIHYIACNSYGLYLSHAIVLAFFVNVYVHTGMPGYGPVYFIGSLAAIAPACLALPTVAKRLMASRKRRPQPA